MIDAGSGAILYEQNAYEQRDPASITKIITALIALENLDMNEEVTAYNEPDLLSRNEYRAQGGRDSDCGADDKCDTYSFCKSRS